MYGDIEKFRNLKILHAYRRRRTELERRALHRAAKVVTHLQQASISAHSALEGFITDYHSVLTGFGWHLMSRKGGASVMCEVESVFDAMVEMGSLQNGSFSLKLLNQLKAPSTFLVKNRVLKQIRSPSTPAF